MKLFRLFGKSIKDSFKSVFRNFSLSLASISCITITLIIVAISGIMTFNVNNFADMIKKDVTIVVFIEKDTTSEEVEEVKKKIEVIPNVDTSTLEFISKGETKNNMASSYSELAAVMATWDESDNPLYDSFKLKVNDINKISETASTIEKIVHVYSVNYGASMIDKLITAFKMIQEASIYVVVALVIVTVFLINNTIKLTIDNRKEEINIMRVVGASNFTIRNPFVVEGMLLGIIGSIIPIVICTYGYMSFYNYFGGRLFNSSLVTLIKPEPFIYQVSAIVLLLGIVVGMIGSYRAVRKYLKV